MFFTNNIWAAPAEYDLQRNSGDINGVVTICGEGQGILNYVPGTSIDAKTDFNENFKFMIGERT